MHPDAKTLWRGPRWTLALLLAGLSSLGPFAIDTYLPAFDGMTASLPATPVQMQQTLSVYLLAFAAMNLFHGALADSFGRRRVMLWGIGVFTLASVGCAMAPDIATLLVFRALQGLSCGAGMVVARTVVRDLYGPVDAQRVLSQVTIYFAVAPAVAPMIGGVLFVHLGWPSIFWFLAAISLLLWGAAWRKLPETLHPSQRQSFSAGHLLRGYRQMMASGTFMALVLASSVPFNAMFLFVLASPAFLGELLGLAPTQYFWFFCVSVAGVMGGAAVSGRLAGRVTPQRQIGLGFAVMGVAAVWGIAMAALLPPHPLYNIPPTALVSFGWSLLAPAVTLLVLDRVPERRGMASSVQSSVGSTANALVAGVLAPLVMHSMLGLALTSAALMAVGWLSWIWVRRRLD